MIVGNDRPQQILKQFFAKIRETGEVHFPFLLLSGPAHIGKTSLIEEEIAQLTGFFANQDYRPLYDLSELLGKQHTLKVEVSDKDQRVEIDGQHYMDLGARDVISWLSLAPAGDFKVVYLENIERMNPSAANALLKTWEEPLSQRLIVASTTNKEALLDTILSRAFVVDFSPLTKQQVDSYIEQHHADLGGDLQEFLSAFSLGKIGLISQYLEMSPTELDNMAENFAGLQSSLAGSVSAVTTNRHFQYFQDNNMWRQVCEALAFVSSDQQAYDAVQSYIRAYQLSGTQVNDAHVAFQLALHASV